VNQPALCETLLEWADRRELWAPLARHDPDDSAAAIVVLDGSISEEPAVSLHAYSPPLRRVGTYEVAENGALLRHPRPSETPLEAAA
jgi:hypothetical protein